MSKVVYLNETSFKESALESGKVVLVDFYADWCGPCRMLAPILEEVASQVGDNVIVAKVNVDENQNLAREYGVMSIPTMFVFKNGNVVDRLTGVRPTGALVEALSKHL